MATLKFKIKGVEFEYVGQEDEIISFINRFLGESITFPVQAKQVSPTATQRTTQKEMIDYPSPPDKEIIEYITSKPNFSHNLFEIQNHFFGQTFKSRGPSKRMYHRTSRQMRLIRRTIEEQYNGKFIETKGPGKGLKRFIFKKSTTSAWDEIGKGAPS